MSRPVLIWRQLHFGLPLEEKPVRDMLVALATLPGSPRIVFECAATCGQLAWYVGIAPKDAASVEAALTTHIQALRLEPTARKVEEESDVTDTFQQAASLHIRGGDRLPLRYEQTESVVRGLLGALAVTNKKCNVRLQVLLGVRLRPRIETTVDVDSRRAVRSKLAEHGFGCAVRLLAETKVDGKRTARLISGWLGTLRGLEAPGVRFEAWQIRPSRVVQVSSPWLWPLRLRISDLVPLLAFPVISPPIPGMPGPHPKLLPPVKGLTGRSSKHKRELGSSLVFPPRPVMLSVADSLRHLHVIGPTGVGKSTLLARLALQDAAAGRSVVVIDPKGDLVRDVAERLPQYRLEDVVLLDPTSPSPVGLNGLSGAANQARREVNADAILSVFHAIYADSWGPRTEDILASTLTTLARRSDGSLTMVPLLLTNAGVRRSLTQEVRKNDPLGLGTFWNWYDGISDAERTHAIAPLMNKLRSVLLRPGLRAVFGQRRPKFSLDEVFSKRRILLVSLARGEIGTESARLLGSLVTALLWQAALGRIAVRATLRHPVMVYIDEVHEYLRLPGDLGDALAQARGLGVSYTLSHQHLTQLPPSLRSTLLSNVQSRLCFRTSTEDAKVLIPLMSGPSPVHSLVADDLTHLAAFDAYARLVRGGERCPSVSLHTRPLSSPVNSLTAVQRSSQQRYGQPLDEVERDLLNFSGLGGLETGNDQPIGRRQKGPEASIGGGR